MKKILLLLLLLAISLSVFLACEDAEDSSLPLTGTTAQTPVDDTTEDAEDTQETQDSHETTAVLTEADTTYEDILYVTDPIEGEMGQPLAINWNPYLLSPLLSEDETLTKGAEAMITAILNRRLTVRFDSLETMHAVCYNLFYEFPPAALCEISLAEDTLTAHISYRLGREEHLLALDAFGEKVESIIAENLLFGDTEAEKAILLYHAVASTVDYYTVVYEPWQTNAYNALMTGKSICYGFADAYNYLLRQVGMEAYLVKGYNVGRAHGWSLIKVDGLYYHCDPTWESSIYDGASFIYFGVTDAKRWRSIDPETATVGDGSLVRSVPHQANDDRFGSFNADKVRAGWTLDRQKKAILYKGKEYSYGA